MFDLPLEYALIEFEDAKFSGKIVPELLDLAARGIVRYVDIAFIQKAEDGTTTDPRDQRPRARAVRDVRPRGRARLQPLHHR